MNSPTPEPPVNRLAAYSYKRSGMCDIVVRRILAAESAKIALHSCFTPPLGQTLLGPMKMPLVCTWCRSGCLHAGGIPSISTSRPQLGQFLVRTWVRRPFGEAVSSLHDLLLRVISDVFGL